MPEANGDGEKWFFPRPRWLFLWCYLKAILEKSENKIILA